MGRNRSLISMCAERPTGGSFGASSGKLASKELSEGLLFDAHEATWTTETENIENQTGIRHEI